MNCSDIGERGRCANHGYFCNDISNLGCICDKNWSSFGSLSLTEGSECAIHIPSTTVLFYIDAVVSSTCFIMIVRLFIFRMMKAKSLWIFKCDSVSLVPLCFCISVFSGTLVDILHIIYAGYELVGSNVSLTLAYFFAVFFGILGRTLYFFVILNGLRGQSDYTSAEEALKLKEKYDFLSILALFIPPTAFIVAFMPLLGILYPKYRDQFLRTFISGIGVICYQYGIIVTLAFSYLLKSLADHIKTFEQTSEIIIVVHRRLRRACYATAPFILLGPFFVLWGNFHAIFIRSTYIFAAALFIMPIGCLILIITVSNIKPEEDPKASENVIITNISQKVKSINLFTFISISQKVKRRSINLFTFIKGSIVTPFDTLSVSSHSNSPHDNVHAKSNGDIRPIEEYNA